MSTDTEVMPNTLKAVVRPCMVRLRLRSGNLRAKCQIFSKFLILPKKHTIDEQSVHLTDFSLSDFSSSLRWIFHKEILTWNGLSANPRIPLIVFHLTSTLPIIVKILLLLQIKILILNRTFSCLDIAGCFDPLAKTTKKIAWQLNEGQNDFVTTYFSKWLGETVIQDSILEECPIPDHSLLKPA